jgi:hypothetical protein
MDMSPEDSGGSWEFWAVRHRPDRLNIGCPICQLSFPHTRLTVVMAQRRE